MSILDKLQAADAENHARMMEALDRISSPFNGDFLPPAFSLLTAPPSDNSHVQADDSPDGDDSADATDASIALRRLADVDGSSEAAAAVATAHLLLDAPDTSALPAVTPVAPLDLSFVCAPISPLSHVASPISALCGDSRVGEPPEAEARTPVDPPQFIDVALHNIVGVEDLAGRGKYGAVCRAAAMGAEGVLSKRLRGGVAEVSCLDGSEEKEGESGDRKPANEVDRKDGGGVNGKVPEVGSGDVDCVSAEPAISAAETAAMGNSLTKRKSPESIFSGTSLNVSPVEPPKTDGACPDGAGNIAVRKTVCNAANSEKAGQVCDTVGDIAKPFSPAQRAARARDQRRAAIARFRLKKQAKKLRPKSKKFIRYDCRKVLACQRPRVKGRFVRVENAQKAKAS